MKRVGFAKIGTLSLMLLGAALAGLPAQAQTQISLDASGLNAQGTFYLDFQLLDGNGIGDGNSTTTLSGLALSGGTLGAAQPSTGTVSGNPATGLTLTDSDPGGVAEFKQAFTVSGPTSQLNFNVGLSSTAPLDTPIPDTFNFLILQGDGITPLPTDGPTGVELVSSNFTSPSPPLTGYGTTSESPVSLTASVGPAAVPEPSSMALLGAGLLALARLAVYRRQGSGEWRKKDH